MKQKVAILLSTYNGEKYLEEQIQSLKNQSGVRISILVRDDGSSDKTKKMLDQWQDEGVLSWYEGENIKPAKSFLQLMKNAPDADYYAFCDQDDIWDKNKLKVAVSKLNKLNKLNNDRPALYFSNAQLVDNDMNPIIGVKYSKQAFSFGGTLIRNNATGCTFVFNEKLLSLVNLYEPDYIMMHDHWVYSLCRAVDGQVYFDNISYIKYRQHDSNVLGGQVSIKQKLRFNSLTSKGNPRYRQAFELYKGYKEILPKENRSLLEDILNYKISFKNRVDLALNKNLRTHTKYDIMFVIATLLGKY